LVLQRSNCAEASTAEWIFPQPGSLASLLAGVEEKSSLEYSAKRIHLLWFRSTGGEVAEAGLGVDGGGQSASTKWTVQAWP
jgi:hypothetical protein